MSRYVLGFRYCESDGVLLIQKNRPEWQAGLWNGLGGKINDGERPIDAMVREFNEESGLSTTEDEWREVVLLAGDNHWAMYVFVSVGAISGYRTECDEGVLMAYRRGDLPSSIEQTADWLLRLCFDVSLSNVELHGRLADQSFAPLFPTNQDHK